MRYTYKGKDYPKELNIKHQEVFTTLSKDPMDITRHYIETGIYPLMFLPTYLIWDNADNPDFGEQ